MLPTNRWKAPGEGTDVDAGRLGSGCGCTVFIISSLQFGITGLHADDDNPAEVKDANHADSRFPGSLLLH